MVESPEGMISHDDPSTLSLYALLIYNIEYNNKQHVIVVIIKVKDGCKRHLLLPMTMSQNERQEQKSSYEDNNTQSALLSSPIFYMIPFEPYGTGISHSNPMLMLLIP